MPKEQIKVTGNEVWVIFKPVSLYDEMDKTRGNKKKIRIAQIHFHEAIATHMKNCGRESIF